MKADIKKMVEQALAEDIGTGDITAQLVLENAQATARVITREDMVMCGVEWIREVFHQVNPDLTVSFDVEDGQFVTANSQLFTVTGQARSILTGERNALNFCQMLSATATVTKHYVDQLEGTSVKLLDTRKTIPLYRNAQKYAVTCGGGQNHRMGLFDAFLIKENHIAAAGSIKAAVENAHQIAPGKTVEVEVESLSELQEALNAKADIVMLDNFTTDQMREAVALNNHQAKLEVSGNVTGDQLQAIAATGVDFISTGAITKHIQAIDLSMRFVE